jgi:hypothetical protein
MMKMGKNATENPCEKDEPTLLCRAGSQVLCGVEMQAGLGIEQSNRFFKERCLQDLVISPQFGFFHSWLESFGSLILVASQQFKTRNSHNLYLHVSRSLVITGPF